MSISIRRPRPSHPAGHSAERPHRPHRPALAALVAVTDALGARSADSRPPLDARSVPCRHAVAVLPRPGPGRRSSISSTRAIGCAIRSTATSGTSCRPRTIRRSSRSMPTIRIPCTSACSTSRSSWSRPRGWCAAAAWAIRSLLHCAIDDGRTLRDEPDRDGRRSVATGREPQLQPARRGRVLQLAGPGSAEGRGAAEGRRRDRDGALQGAVPGVQAARLSRTG